MIGAVILSYIFMIDPSDRSWGADVFPALKYLPVELALVALGLYVISTRVSETKSVWATSLSIMCGLVLTGSAYTLFVHGSTAEHSFLGRGLGILALFPAYRMFLLRRESRLFLRWFWLPTLLTAGLISAQVIAWWTGARFVEKPHIFHEEVFIVAAAAALVYALRRCLFLRWPLTLFFLGSCVLTVKNTGYLAALVAAGIVAAIAWQRTQPNRMMGTVLRRTAILEILLIGAALGTLILVARRDILPSGSPEVRLITYAQRLGMFVDSPIVGRFFTGSPMMELPGRYSVLVTPSHSDMLDILAFGGLLGFFLLLLPLVQLSRTGIAKAVHYHSSRDWPDVYFLTVLLVFGMEMIFNPVWNQPKLALSFWLAVGYSLASHSRSRTRCRRKLALLPSATAR
jgi:hypothetical protein